MVSCLLEKVHAIPVKDVLSFDEAGYIHSMGRRLDQEESQKLILSASALSDSYALRFVRDQVTRECIKMGVYQAMTTEQIMFAKAALWYIQEETKLLTLLNSLHV